MTAIAYRGGVMAADSRFVLDNLRAPGKPKPKIMRAQIGWLDDVETQEALVGVAGDECPDDHFVREWLGENALYELPSLYGKFTALIATSSGGLFLVDHEGDVTRLEAEFYAVGSGAEVCIGAMEMGANATQAVAAAIKWSPLCEGPLTAEMLHGYA